MNAGSESTISRCAVWTNRKKRSAGIPRVLVVDDFKDAADAIGTVLGIIGFDSEVAYGGLPAINIARRWQPEIVLLDIWMPDLSGLDVAKRLRESDDTSDTILIAHSAAAGQAELARAKKAGFDAFCAKPTDALHLGPLLRYFVPENRLAPVG